MAKKKKTNKYLAEATRLANSRYSAAFEQIAANTRSNLSAYNTGSSQRITNLNKELGSMEAAHVATQKSLSDLGVKTGTLYQQALSQSQSDAQKQQAQQNSMATGLATSLQSERQARGLDQPTNAEASLNYESGRQSELLASIQSLNQGALQRQNTSAQDMMKGFKASEMFLDTTHKSAAKGLAQSELMSLYNSYLQQKQQLEGERTVTEKERGDYIVQTEMTLKEQARQRAAQKAAAAASAAIAAGNLAYKYESLGVNTQYKYDKLAQDKAQKDIENKFKMAGLSAKLAGQAAKQYLDDNKFKLEVDKFNWNKSKTVGGTNLADTLKELFGG